jgi:hypothetical protein
MPARLQKLMHDMRELLALFHVESIAIWPRQREW